MQEILTSGTDSYICTVDVEINSEEWYVDSITRSVALAIDGYKSDRRKKATEAGALPPSSGPNALFVYKDRKPEAMTLLDFGSQTGMADVFRFRNCASVNLRPSNEENVGPGCLHKMGIYRTLGIAYPSDGNFGRPRVMIGESMNGRRFIQVFGFDW